MTYSSTITADSPKLYFRLGEASGNLADTGSVGGSATVGSGGLTYAQSPAGTIDGYSAYFGGTNSLISQTFDNTAFSAVTFEFWYKRNTSYSLGTAPILYLENGGTGNYLGMQIGSTGAVFVGSQGTLGTTTTIAAVADGNWHHIVYTHSGSTGKLYVDGVLKASPTGSLGPTNSAMIAQIGAYSGAVQCNLDEVAVYSTALTQTQVTAHYNAGTAVASTPVTVTPPYINLGTLTEVAPPFAGIGDVTVAVPAMALNPLTVPVPVTTAGTGVTNAVPAATLSLAMPAANFALAQSGSYSITHNKEFSSTSDAMMSETSTLNNAMFFQLGSTVTVPNGKTLNNAFLTLVDNASAGQGMNFNIGYLNTAYASAQPSNVVVVGSGSFTSTGVGYVANIDITPVINAWLGGATQYGIAIVPTSFIGTGTHQIQGIDAGANAPKVATYYSSAPVSINVAPPAMTASMTAAAPVVSTTSSVSSAAPAASLSIDVIAPGVSTTISAINAVPAQAMTLSFPGGVPVNPDFSATATVMTLGLTTPNAGVSIQYPAIALVPAIDAGTLDTAPATINLTTNVLKAVPAMSMTVKWVGIYVAEADRYITKVNGTVDPFAKWFRMDEVSGTAVKDWAFNGGTGVDNGSIGGTVGYLVDGPYLRKAMHFNGVNSYIEAGNYTPIYTSSSNSYSFGPNNNGTSLEFSIRTTATDGVILAGGAASTPSNTFVQNYDKGFDIRLVNGQLWVNAHGGYSYKVRATINDGQWHHIVVSSAYKMNVVNKSFVNVDGVRSLTRLEAWSGTDNAAMLPRTVMARRDVTTGAVTDFLAGDMRDLVVRMANPVSDDLAVSLYYEWSNATIAAAEPMTVSLSTATPFSVKGNVKKMLAIYGAPSGYLQQTSFNMPLNTYYGPQSGLMIKHWSYVSPDTSNSGFGGFGARPAPVILSDIDAHNAARSGGGDQVSSGFHYTKPVTFFDAASGYLVHPVWIYGDSALSADGLLNGEYEFTEGNGVLIDDATGLPRFVNLQEDIALDMSEFDVLTVVNYPPSQVAGNDFFGTLNSANEYNQTRDAFRDSIMEACYSGTSLWMPEWEMAKHCGFIEDVDNHTAGGWPEDIVLDAQGHVLFAAGHNINYAGELLDRQHMRMLDGVTPYNRNLPADPANLTDPALNAYYKADGQVNVKFRIVNTEPGLTDLPGWEMSNKVYRQAYDDWNVTNTWYAYDLIDRSGGLQVGDQIDSLVIGNMGGITSVRPQGIIGKVISKEMQWYYGPFGTKIINPFSENAYAIATERGSVVRGRAIRGRAFIGLMDANYKRTSIWEDADSTKNWMDGHTAIAAPISSWNYDSRREHDVALTIVTNKMNFDPSSGQMQTVATKLSYFDWGTVPGQSHPSVSMNRRGLNWLAEDHAVNADDATTYAAVMTLSVTMPNVTITHDRNMDIQVGNAMRLDLEIRDAANYRGNDVSEHTLPMQLALDMHGIGAVVAAPVVASLTLTTPNAVALAHGDNVAVYMDSDNTISVFLKEDN